MTASIESYINSAMSRKNIYILILLVIALHMIACSRDTSESVNVFKDNVRRLNRLLDEYANIPEKKGVYEQIPNENGVAVIILNLGKDRDKLNSFYKRTAKEWEATDRALENTASNQIAQGWQFDSIFCRGVLRIILTEIDLNKSLARRTINTLGEYINISSEGKLHKWTKNEMKKNFFNKYRELFSPDLSDEENIKVYFLLISAYQYMRLNEFKKAIIQYEAIVNSYPTSPLVDDAKAQIEVCKEFMEGRVPEHIYGKPEENSEKEK